MPLSFHRLVKAVAAVSLASVPLAGLSTPAFAASATPPASAASAAPGYEWWLRTLHVIQAWRSDEGTNVTVAVLSDGIAPGEGFLAGSVIQGPDFTGSRRTAHSRYYGVLGTSLAGLIAGHGSRGYTGKGGRSYSGEGGKSYSGKGTTAVYGIAPDARVLSVRVTLSPGDPLWSDSRLTARLPDAIAAGIRYAVRHGARVIDLPADPGIKDPAISSGSPAAAGGSAAERSAVSYAIRKGALLVAPAGDNGQAGDAANYPAAYPGVLAVGAFGQSFVKAPYSSRRSYVTLTAAGQGVRTADRHGFLTINSTCAASAIVTGIAALIRSEFPNLTAAQVRRSMTDSTVFGHASHGHDGSGYGTVDAERSLASATRLSPPHARPAMAGALPRAHPVAPAIESTRSVIMHQISGDAAIAAALLAVLLGPIAIYGLAMKRREQREAILAAQRSQADRTTSGSGSMLADPLLEFFAPQHVRPTSQLAATRVPTTPRFQPRPGLTGRSMLSAPLPARLADAPGETPSWPASPAPSAPSATAQPASGSAPPYGSAPAGQQAAPIGIGSYPIARKVQVTGSPPWEPAEQPSSDLPWALVAPQPVPPRPGGAETAAIPPPPDSVWDSAPSHRPPSPDMPHSLFDPAPAAPGEPESAPRPDLPRRTPGRSSAGRRSTADKRSDGDRGPIFVWKPTNPASGERPDS